MNDKIYSFYLCAIRYAQIYIKSIPVLLWKVFAHFYFSSKHHHTSHLLSPGKFTVYFTLDFDVHTDFVRFIIFPPRACGCVCVYAYYFILT